MPSILEKSIFDNDNNVKEDMQTMIQNNGTSMSNKAQATGDMSSEVPMGAQQTGGLNEDFNLLEEINKNAENEVISKQPISDKLTISKLVNIA